MITALCNTAGVPIVNIRRIPPLALKALGVFTPIVREIAELRYQFDAPFVVDSSATQTTFGLDPTAVDDALDKTVSWYRSIRTTEEQGHGRDHLTRR